MEVNEVIASLEVSDNSPACSDGIGKANVDNFVNFDNFFIFFISHFLITSTSPFGLSLMMPEGVCGFFSWRREVQT